MLTIRKEISLRMGSISQWSEDTYCLRTGMCQCFCIVLRGYRSLDGPSLPKF